jgi:ribosomal protein S18 acetylase RimI-like enzyme
LEALRIAAAYVEALRRRALSVHGGEALEMDGLLIALTNLPVPELNTTVVTREPRQALRALAAAEEAFRTRGHAFFGIELESGRHPAVEEAARAIALQLLFSRPIMAAPIVELPDADPLPGVQIDAVSSRADLEAVRVVEVEAFGTDPAVAERFLGPRLLRTANVRLLVARDGERPVGQAATWLVENTVGVFGVGVVESARGQRLGSALTEMASRSFGREPDFA